MKKLGFRLSYLFFIIGGLFLLLGIGRMVYLKVTAVPQDEVVSEGFTPLLVPENMKEALAQAGDTNSADLLAPAMPTLVSTLTPEANLTLTAPSATKIAGSSEPITTPTFGPAIPDRIVIPVISLDAPIIEAVPRKIRVENRIYDQYKAPNEFAAGWHPNSALLGVKGNTVLNGHHNEYGKVFGGLVDLNPGDVIYVYSGLRRFEYVVANKMILPELGDNVPVAQRLQNARWILPSEDERLTLVTCWPAYSNTHRLIIVASPLGMETLTPNQ